MTCSKKLWLGATFILSFAILGPIGREIGGVGQESHPVLRK